jgi:PhnB protein
MARQANASANGAQTITPHLVVKGGAEAIDFYIRAFGAVELSRVACPQSGQIMHAALQIGNSKLFLCDEFPQGCALSPKTVGGTPVTIHLDVEDVDARFRQAVDAGATSAMEPADMFWGDRYGQVVDPFGHRWSLATHIEDVTPEQIGERMKAFAPPEAVTV